MGCVHSRTRLVTSVQRQDTRPVVIPWSLIGARFMADDTEAEDSERNVHIKFADLILQRIMPPSEGQLQFFDKEVRSCQSTLQFQVVISTSP